VLPLRDSISYHGPAAITKLLIALNVLVFWWQVGGGPVGFERIVFAYGFVPAEFFAAPAAEAYRLVTSMFLHGGVAHLLGNMWFLWVFGPALEGRLGWARYASLYLLAGVVAAFVQGVLTAGSGVPVVGASGAISGVLGAYFVLFRREYVLSLFWFVFPRFIWLPVGLYLGYWALIQFLYALAGVPGTAWWAHLGGFVLGALLGPSLRQRHPYRSTPYWQGWGD